jgi:hypothetical protein
MWATAISTHAQNGRKILWRYGKEFSSEFVRASQPVRVIIAWKYGSETGLPISEDHDRMNIMEDALESVLDEDDFATLALVSTGEGLREWTYYAGSEDEFMERLNLALSELPEFPIEIHIAKDPDWNMYDEFQGGVRE